MWRRSDSSPRAVLLVVAERGGERGCSWRVCFSLALVSVAALFLPSSTAARRAVSVLQALRGGPQTVREGTQCHGHSRPEVGPVNDLGGACVVGVWEPGRAAFRGLPFAAPPVGPRRWMPAEPYVPQQADDSEDVWEASTNSPACFQDGAASDSSASESEDCLYLNVFVPQESFHGDHLESGGEHASNRTLLPVLFWIHGGMNFIGSASSYGPIENLVPAGPFVLIVPQYRLNVFGFLALHELAARDPRGVSGNFGITDLQLALLWVQANVATFGGDANRVTIMGQSSGGTNVLALLAGKANRGLFHRAISLSGSPNITMDRATKEALDRVIVDNSPCAGMKDELLRWCLYNLPAETVYSAMPESYGAFSELYDYPVDQLGLGVRTNSRGERTGVSPLLYVDGVTVSSPLEDALLSGLNDVPLLLQSMQTEMACFPLEDLDNADEDDLNDFFSEKFSPAFGEGMADQVYAQYANLSRDFSYEYAAYAVDSDTASGCGLQALAAAAAKGFRSPVYWGTVQASASGVVDTQRLAFHGWDVQAAIQAWDGNPTLGVDGKTPIYSNYPPSASDITFGAKVLSYLAEMAVDGALSGTDWARVEPDKAPVGSVVGASVTKPLPGFKLSLCDFWRAKGIGKQWWWIN